MAFRPITLPVSRKALQETLGVWRINQKMVDPTERGHRLLDKGSQLMQRGKSFYSVAATSFHAAAASFGSALDMTSQKKMDPSYCEACRGEADALKQARRFAESFDAYQRLEKLSQITARLIELEEGPKSLYRKFLAQALAASRCKEESRDLAYQATRDEIALLERAAGSLFQKNKLWKAERNYRELQDLAQLAALLTVDDHDRLQWEHHVRGYGDLVRVAANSLGTLQMATIRLDDTSWLLLNREREIVALRFGHTDIPFREFPKKRFLQLRNVAVSYDEEGGEIYLSQKKESRSLVYTLDLEDGALGRLDLLNLEIGHVLEMHGGETSPCVRILADHDQMIPLFDLVEQKMTEAGEFFVRALEDQTSRLLAPGRSMVVEFASPYEHEREDPWFGVKVSRKGRES